MTLAQFKEKTKWMNPDATLVWLGADRIEVELDRVYERPDLVAKLVLRGVPTEKELREVRDKVRAAIEGSSLGGE
jgi:hypothetical protein